MKKWKLNKEGDAYVVPTHQPVKASADNPTGLIPLYNRILVKCEPVKTETAGGILLDAEYADKEAARNTVGVIVEMGVDAFKGTAWQPEIGDTVSFRAYKATYAVDGGEYRYIPDEELLGANIGGGS